MVQKTLFKTCPKCNGKGYIEGYFSGDKLRLYCKNCYGTGRTIQND